MSCGCGIQPVNSKKTTAAGSSVSSGGFAGIGAASGQFCWKCFLFWGAVAVVIVLLIRGDK